MARKSTGDYRFGDLLALARQSWITQMADGLTARGYPDYRRSDAASVRQLQRGADVDRPARRRPGRVPPGRPQGRRRPGRPGLRRRTARDGTDTRQVNVTLTPAGQGYAKAVTKVIEQLNRELTRRVDPADLAAADAVLRAVLADERAQRVAEFLGRPPA